MDAPDDILKRLSLRLGDFIEIGHEDGLTYKSTLADALDAGFLLLTLPTARGLPVVFRRDQPATLFYVLPSGRFGIDARVAGHKDDGLVRLVVFELLHPPVRKPRRGAYRLAANLSCLVRSAPFAPGGDPALEELTHTLDISDGGLSFKTRAPRQPGEKAYLRLWLTPAGEGEAPPLDLIAQVRRWELIDPGTGLYRVGVQFEGLDRGTAKQITRFILTRQQEILKRRRLVEGE